VQGAVVVQPDDAHSSRCGEAPSSLSAVGNVRRSVRAVLCEQRSFVGRALRFIGAGSWASAHVAHCQTRGKVSTGCQGPSSLWDYMRAQGRCPRMRPARRRAGPPRRARAAASITRRNRKQLISSSLVPFFYLFSCSFCACVVSCGASLSCGRSGEWTCAGGTPPGGGRFRRYRRIPRCNHRPQSCRLECPGDIQMSTDGGRHEQVLVLRDGQGRRVAHERSQGRIGLCPTRLTVPLYIFGGLVFVFEGIGEIQFASWSEEALPLRLH